MTETVKRRTYKTGAVLTCFSSLASAHLGCSASMVNIGTRCMAVYLAEHCTGLFAAGGAAAPCTLARGAHACSGKTSGVQSRFGATQAETDALIGRSAAQALAYFSGNAADASEAVFQHSGIFDPGLDPFPPSRPATTELAKRQGHALGIEVKPGGNRPLQPIVNTFLLVARKSAGNRPCGVLVGQSNAQQQTPFAGESGLILARALCHQRRQGSRLSQDAAADRNIPTPRTRQLSRSADRRGSRPGYAGVSRRRGKHQECAKREFCPRDYGAVHHGSG